jgi:hypothetical protein
MSETTINYARAFEELQAIVTEIELGQITVDILSEKVKRASELIAICKTNTYFMGSNEKILCRLFIKAKTLIISNKSVEYFTPCRYISNVKNFSSLVAKKTRVMLS